VHDSVPETGKWLCSVLQGYYHTVAAAESAIGLAILVVLFRNRNTINVDAGYHQGKRVPIKINELKFIFCCK
jgi:hypothetical protein